MNEWLARFLSYLESEKKYSSETVRAYRNDLNQFVSYLTKLNISLKDINPLILRRFLANLHLKGLARGRYSEKTMARKVASLRAFLSYLAENEVIESGFQVFLPFPKTRKNLPEVLNLKDFEDLIEVTSKDTPIGWRDRAIIEVLFGTGLRVGELVNLNLDSISFERQELKVKGKGGKERVVPLNDEAETALRCYLRAGRPKLFRSKTAAVFLNARGGRLTAPGVRKILKNYSLKLGRGVKVHPHLFRHTLASGLLEGGADLRVVQEILGHSSLSTTQVYLKLSVDRLKRVYRNSHPRG